MKTFNRVFFATCLKQFRTEDGTSQEQFAPKLGLNRSTLSLLETNKQLPSLEILNSFCNLSGKSADEFFDETNDDPILYMMGKLGEEDKMEFERVLRQIMIYEKYDMLNKRNMARRCEKE